jgi:hypothetical protein
LWVAWNIGITAGCPKASFCPSLIYRLNLSTNRSIHPIYLRSLSCTVNSSVTKKAFYTELHSTIVESVISGHISFYMNLEVWPSEKKTLLAFKLWTNKSQFKWEPPAWNLKKH